MFQILKLLYQFLKKKSYSCFDFIRGKRHHPFINPWSHTIDNGEPNYLLKMAANTLGGGGLNKYLRSFKPTMPLLNHDPAIKSMKIEWDTSFIPIDGGALLREGLEEQIINKYVRYVSRHVFVLLQPNKHKILLNATTHGQLGSHQIPVGEQVLYKDPEQLENYLMDNLMGILVSYEASGVEDFTYFISNIDEKEYKELLIKIRALFKKFPQ